VRTVLAQISDPHLAAGSGAEPAEAFAAAVEVVASLDPAPDAVLLSGDLANEPKDEMYGRIVELIEPLSMPVHVLAGNHDDSAALRSRFDVPGEPGDPIQYVERIGAVRMIACDTSIPGRDDGALGADRLGWLEAQLARDTETPAILAMHHPPLRLGVPAIDALGLADSDRTALAELVARSPQVRRIIAGHVHRGAVGDLGGCPVFVCPSSYLQLALDLHATEIALVREPPCVAFHVVEGTSVISHLQPTGDYGAPFVP
jgi:Icc protein